MSTLKQEHEKAEMVRGWLTSWLPKSVARIAAEYQVTPADELILERIWISRPAWHLTSPQLKWLKFLVDGLLVKQVNSFLLQTAGRLGISSFLDLLVVALAEVTEKRIAMICATQRDADRRRRGHKLVSWHSSDHMSQSVRVRVEKVDLILMDCFDWPLLDGLLRFLKEDAKQPVLIGGCIGKNHRLANDKDVFWPNTATIWLDAT